MDFTEYVKAEMLILIPVLYALGMTVKKTEKISDKYIPLVITGVGVVLSLMYIIATEGFTLLGAFTAIVQGVLVSAGAVYSNQLIKQSTKQE